MFDHHPSADLAQAILSSYLLPDTVKHHVLVSAAERGLLIGGPAHAAAALPLRTAPARVLRTVIGAHTNGWQLPRVSELAHVDASVLDALWRAAQQTTTQDRWYYAARQMIDASIWALHPAATPGQRAAALDIVTEFSQRQDLSAGPAIPSQLVAQVLRDIDTHGYVGAGGRLPLSALGAFAEIAAAMVPMVTAAFDAHAHQLESPNVAATLAAMTGTFHGTVEELITTCAAIAH